MKKIPFLQILLIIVLMLGATGWIAPVQGSAAVKVQSVLVELASQDPQQTLRVIVQKMPSATGVEERVAELGGLVTRDLYIINSFAAEMTAGAVIQLARTRSVRWISLDGKMQSSDITESTGWATTIGTEEIMGISNGSNLVDSSLGPNGKYATGFEKNKGSVTGFQFEIVPGNAITKVEVILIGYVPSVINHDVTIKIWLSGSKIKEYSVSKFLWRPYDKASDPGQVVIDITNARTWKWADLANTPAISFDFGSFNSKDSLALDAVGLRVTSNIGTDTSMENISIPPADDSAVDGSNQVVVYNQVIGTTQLWDAENELQGKKITVALVDSGISKTKDLSGRLRVNVNFNTSYHDSADRYGHGTFLAGIIAGNGSESNGKYIGVAPKAILLNVRVTNDQGQVYESELINSLQWVYDNRTRYKIRVVNLSINSSVAQSYDTSPLDAAVEILWFNGIVVVVSAGNNDTGIFYPPANDPFVITVGATDDKATPSTSDDSVATFSAYGTTESGFAKPDLVAPGRLIVGLLPENDNLSIGKEHPSNRVDANYFNMSGTSVSAAMVSGAVAILLQDEPNLTPDQVKYRLMATANTSWAGYNAAAAGAGYLDIYNAVFGTTTETANTGILASQLLSTGSDPIAWGSVGWNSVGWNTVGWNTVGWNTVGWNTVGWNTVGWNTDYWGP